MMLAPCTLGVRADLHKGEKGWAAWEENASQKLRRWIQGEVEALWSEAVQMELHNVEYETGRTSSAEPSENAPTSLDRRVERLVRAGRFSDAAAALMDEAPIPTTPEVVETLRAKFPKARDPLVDVRVPSDQCHPLRGEQVRGYQE